MKTVTIEQVMEWAPSPCPPYTQGAIETLFDGRTELAADDIASLTIPPADMAWALLHESFLTEEQMRAIAHELGHCNEEVHESFPGHIVAWNACLDTYTETVCATGNFPLLNWEAKKKLEDAFWGAKVNWFLEIIGGKEVDQDA